MQVIDNGDELPTPHAGAAKCGMGAEDLAVTLSLGDLLPDANGDVVIVSAGGRASLSIVTEERIRESGMADGHVTADGFDVGGFAFCAFESGTTLYYSPDLNLTIAQAEAY